MSSVHKISKTNISHEVYNQIRNNIKDGMWPAGSKIPSENELANQFGVSRVSVRNAVNILSGQGILESRHGEGTFVSDLSIDSYFRALVPLLTVNAGNLVAVYEFRKILEVGNVRLLFRNLKETDVSDLENNYSEMLSAQDDIEKFVNLDYQFHQLIADKTGNPVCGSMHEILRKALLPFQLRVQTAFGTKGGSKYHRLVLDAITRGKEDEAVALMTEHMEMTIRNIRTNRQNID